MRLVISLHDIGKTGNCRAGRLWGKANSYQLIRKNPGTISLGQGVVNYPPPQEAIDHIDTFLSDPDNHKYKPVQGIPELLDLVDAKLSRENGFASNGNTQTVITAGSNMAFLAVALAVTDPGDEVILQLPSYFNHERAVGIAGCKAVCVPTDDTYQLQPGAIEKAITKRTSTSRTVTRHISRQARSTALPVTRSRSSPCPRRTGSRVGGSVGW